MRKYSGKNWEISGNNKKGVIMEIFKYKERLHQARLELKSLQLELENVRKEQEIKLREVKAGMERDYLDHNAKLKREFDDKEAKLEEQRRDFAIKIRTKKEDEILKIKADYNDRLVAAKEEVMNNYYKKIQDELAKVHSEGNANTKFIKDATLELMKNAAPAQNGLQIEHKEVK